MKKKPKQYRIDSLEKLLNIATEENFTRLMRDFNLWVNWYICAIQQIRKNHPECADIPNYTLANAHMIWKDDGINEITSVAITDPTTGELTEKRINRKPKNK